MFRGANAINLDTKGRLTIPTKYRQGLMDDCQGQLVCTIDITQKCLLLYPLPEWEEIELKLRTFSSMNDDERRLQRLLLGNAADGDMDKSGRFLIAPNLRAFLDLKKSVMLVGQLNRFEIWDADTWQAQLEADIAVQQQGGFELSERLQDFAL
ncbi:division/cell wall cluster transcriptional repressor MraZ [Glaciecola sp. 1036]|uniref:division/cell wall cluster transcriptional repressor MraZ n=1 Tax=Alteromonadaceae TaxID=72275 RepID=UPI003D05A158